MGRPLTLGGASVRIPMQPVQVVNAPLCNLGTWWAAPSASPFRMDPAGMVMHGNLKAGRWRQRSHAAGWLTNRICGKPSCPTAPCPHCLEFLSCDVTARKKWRKEPKQSTKAKGDNHNPVRPAVPRYGLSSPFLLPPAPLPQTKGQIRSQLRSRPV